MGATTCRVTIGDKRDNIQQSGRFLGVFQRSQVLDPSPLLGGHSGGVVAFPVYVVQVGNDILEIKDCSRIVFD